jgi:hypothetical protein
MKGDAKYYAIIIGVFLLLFVANRFKDEPTDYTHTFSHKDKNPYGSYLLKELMPDLFDDHEVESLNMTLYEIEERLTPDKNLLIIADNMYGGAEEIEVLLNAVNEGMNAMIVANTAYSLTDTLGISVEFNSLGFLVNANQDSTYLKFASRDLPQDHYQFKSDVASHNFSDLDSLDYGLIAVNASGDPMAIKVPHGKGNIILATTPMVFTNDYFFYENNHEYAATLLSYLPKKDMIWSEYYQLGRIEVSTPLRVILQAPALKLAYTLTIVALLLFMIFEAKRKQRIIPIVRPLANTTLEFIGTITNLYLRKKDHLDIALKRIQYFQESIQARYFMNFKKLNDEFFEKLAAKSGNEVRDVKELFDLIQRIKERETVSEQELKSLSDKIEAFYGR